MIHMHMDHNKIKRTHIQSLYLRHCCHCTVVSSNPHAHSFLSVQLLECLGRTQANGACTQEMSSSVAPQPCQIPPSSACASIWLKHLKRNTCIGQ